MTSSLLQVQNLEKTFSMRKHFFDGGGPPVLAVKNASFEIKRGESLSLVGESGCGKTTLGRCIARLIDVTSGHLFFENEEITSAPLSDLKKFRKNLQIIFQNSRLSLNPRMTIEATLKEPYIIHKESFSQTEKKDRIHELLNLVGLRHETLSRFPHELSGGQQQRVGIARALALQPKFIICDEPVSSLDAFAQAQVIHLLRDLQQKLELTYLFITHNLNLIEGLTKHVAVMRSGCIVELAQTKEFFAHPRHPYSRLLLSAALTRKGA